MSGVASDESEFQSERQQLATPEHLLFLVDVHQEQRSIFDPNNNRTRLQIIIDIIQRIVKRKSTNPVMKHQYALAIFNDVENFFVLRPFKTDTEELFQILDILDIIECSSTDFDLHLLFQKIYDSFATIIENTSTVLRCIFIYGRSFEVNAY